MKIYAILSLLLTLPTLSFANTYEISFRCTAGSMESCAQRSQAELDRQKCGMAKDSLHCEKVNEDKKAIYCSARTEKCSEVSSDGYSGVTCNGTKARIKDRKLSATWAKGFFRSWVKEMCIEKT